MIVTCCCAQQVNMFLKISREQLPGCPPGCRPGSINKRNIPLILIALIIIGINFNNRLSI